MVREMNMAQAINDAADQQSAIAVGANLFVSRAPVARAPDARSSLMNTARGSFSWLNWKTLRTAPKSIGSAVGSKSGETRASGGRIWAVGTTSVRTLESVADAEGAVHAGSGETTLFIRPPYSFRVVDALVTNFHLPRSTLLMLVSALAGYDRTMSVYRAAVAEGYRFYSYGDAMVVLPTPR